eukprot:5943-Heterococcus_DN1.PRE.3
MKSSIARASSSVTVLDAAASCALSCPPKFYNNTRSTVQEQSSNVLVLLSSATKSVHACHDCNNIYILYISEHITQCCTQYNDSNTKPRAQQRTTKLH